MPGVPIVQGRAYRPQSYSDENTRMLRIVDSKSENGARRAYRAGTCTETSSSLELEHGKIMRLCKRIEQWCLVCLSCRDVRRDLDSPSGRKKYMGDVLASFSVIQDLVPSVPIVQGRI